MSILFSEPYGKFVARDLDVEEIQVDRKRQKFPISSTDIRKGLKNKESYLEEIVFKDLK